MKSKRGDRREGTHGRDRVEQGTFNTTRHCPNQEEASQAVTRSTARTVVELRSGGFVRDCKRPRLGGWLSSLRPDVNREESRREERRHYCWSR